MRGRLILILSLLSLAAANIIRCVEGGMEPSKRLGDKHSEQKRTWRQVVGDKNVNVLSPSLPLSDSLPNLLSQEYVCVAMIYEVQWSDGVVATDIMLGMELLPRVIRVSAKAKATFFHNEAQQYICQEIDPEKMQVEIKNTYKNRLTKPYDTRFAKIKYFIASIGDTVPLRSIDLDAYDAAMKKFWRVEEFGRVGHCFKGFVNHPYGFAELDTIDLLLSSLSGNLFYSGYIVGPMWCAISFGRLSSSHGAIVPFTRDATIPFANGAFVKDRKTTEEMERKDPHMKTFKFKCFRRDTDAVKEIRHDDWYRAYLPPESRDSTVLICACNADLCNNTDNMEAIRQHFLAPQPHTELSADEFEESAFWSPAEVKND